MAYQCTVHCDTRGCDASVTDNEPYYHPSNPGHFVEREAKRQGWLVELVQGGMGSWRTTCPNCRARSNM